MRYDLLAKELADQGVGVLGETLFIFHIPAECKRGVLIKAPLSGIPVDPYLPGYYRGQIQLICRALLEEDAMALAGDVLRALKTTTARRYSEPDGSLALLINYMIPRTLPVIYPRSTGNGIEASLNFIACYVMP